MAANLNAPDVTVQVGRAMEQTDVFRVAGLPEFSRNALDCIGFM